MALGSFPLEITVHLWGTASLGHEIDHSLKIGSLHMHKNT